MKKFIGIASFLLLLVGFSCKKENTATPAEPVKEITGSWRIIKALRNGTDLTTRFDFSAFRIKFSDGNYTIENPVPFIVNKPGTWKFDDPVYPFNISFRTGSDSATSAIQYPVVGGVRNLVVSFSPGCQSNIYEYTLQKEN
ncbi:MAG: DUF5004 domain-containing protein [Bacteroidota bacterium]|nr:DUF5004 domain-containing protein [Ferruginibacter sp.]